MENGPERKRRARKAGESCIVRAVSVIVDVDGFRSSLRDVYLVIRRFFFALRYCYYNFLCVCRQKQSPAESSYGERLVRGVQNGYILCAHVSNKRARATCGTVNSVWRQVGDKKKSEVVVGTSIRRWPVLITRRQRCRTIIKANTMVGMVNCR